MTEHLVGSRHHDRPRPTPGCGSRLRLRSGYPDHRSSRGTRTIPDTTFGGRTGSDVCRRRPRVDHGVTGGNRPTAEPPAMADRSEDGHQSCCCDVLRAFAGGCRPEIAGAFGSLRRLDGGRRRGLETRSGASGAGTHRADVEIVGHTGRTRFACGLHPPSGTCFNKSCRATTGGVGTPRGEAGFVGGKTSEGANPRGVTDAKQSRKGFGRSNASGG